MDDTCSRSITAQLHSKRSQDARKTLAKLDFCWIGASEPANGQIERMAFEKR